MDLVRQTYPLLVGAKDQISNDASGKLTADTQSIEQLILLLDDSILRLTTFSLPTVNGPFFIEVEGWETSPISTALEQDLDRATLGL